MALDLIRARQLAEAALAAGHAAGAPPLAVAVLDARASVKVLLAEDGLGIAMPQIAVGKANACLALGMEGDAIAAVSDQLPGAMSGFVQLAPPFIAVPGARLLWEGGNVVGAVAVTGDSAENDQRYAAAAVSILGTKSTGGC